MKALASMLLVMMATASLAMERHSVVKVFSFDKSYEYRLVNDGEMKALRDELRAESRIYPKALMAAKQEWAKDETKKRKRFPLMSQRNMRVVRTYTTREDAEEKLASYDPERQNASDKKKKNNRNCNDKKACAAAEKMALKQAAVDMITSHIKALTTDNKTEDSANEEP